MQRHDLAAQISLLLSDLAQKLTEGVMVEIPALSTKIGASQGSVELCSVIKTD